MPLIWQSALARADLVDLWLQIAEDNPEQATRMIRQIEQKLGLLVQNPGIGRMRSDLGAAIRSYPVATYLVLYRPVEGGIEVCRVLHGRRDLDTEFIE